LEDGINLGIWLNDQRQSKKKGRLDIKRVTQLNDLGICWNVATEQWERRYQLLRKFNEREGHCNVPKRHVEDGIKLGNWLNNQRQSNKKGCMDTKRVTQLNELGIFFGI